MVVPRSWCAYQLFVSDLVSLAKHRILFFFLTSSSVFRYIQLTQKLISVVFSVIFCRVLRFQLALRSLTYTKGGLSWEKTKNEVFCGAP
jgi:hypothetical protein